MYIICGVCVFRQSSPHGSGPCFGSQFSLSSSFARSFTLCRAGRSCAGAYTHMEVFLFFRKCTTNKHNCLLGGLKCTYTYLNTRKPRVQKARLHAKKKTAYIYNTCTTPRHRWRPPHYVLCVCWVCFAIWRFKWSPRSFLAFIYNLLERP